MPLHVTTLSCQSSRNYHLPPNWDLPSPINILTLRNWYVQSIRLLNSRKGNSHFETLKFQVIYSAHFQANQPHLVEETARVFFPKTTNINLTSPTSTFSHLHSDYVHAVGGEILRPGVHFSKVLITFQARKTCAMFAVFTFKMSFNNFENNKVKLSVNQAKLPGLLTICRNWAFR